MSSLPAWPISVAMVRVKLSQAQFWTLIHVTGGVRWIGLGETVVLKRNVGLCVAGLSEYYGA